MKPNQAVADPAVSRQKFEREIELYRQNQDDYIQRGWWMVKVGFPEIFMVFGTPALAPAMAPFGAVIDFSNYDAQPPSVQLVNPFTREPYKGKDIRFPRLPRRRLVSSPNAQAPHFEIDNLLQVEGPEAIPFICLPGIREYHNHPAHSGDSWFVHRNRGEGTLYFVLNLLGTYGIGNISGYGLQLQVTPQGPINLEQIPE